MFRRWEWDVKGLLRRGENEIRIVFGSPVRFIAGKQAQLSLTGGGDIPGLDRRSYKIGLRTVELRQEPDQWGKEFTFYVKRYRDLPVPEQWTTASQVVTRSLYNSFGGGG
jgi:beta-galactosidase/beta-glucuronidase